MQGALSTWASGSNVLSANASVLFFYSRTYVGQLSDAEDFKMRKKLSKVMNSLAKGRGERKFHARAKDDKHSYTTPFDCTLSENLAASPNLQVSNSQ